MVYRQALSELNYALSAIDVLLRDGRIDAARVNDLARQARHSAETVSRQAPRDRLKALAARAGTQSVLPA